MVISVLERTTWGATGQAGQGIWSDWTALDSIGHLTVQRGNTSGWKLRIRRVEGAISLG